MKSRKSKTNKTMFSKTQAQLSPDFSLTLNQHSSYKYTYIHIYLTLLNSE